MGQLAGQSFGLGMFVGIGQVENPATNDEQAVQRMSDPRLETVAAWVVDPNEAAKIDANALFNAVEELKAEAKPLATELRATRLETEKKKAVVARLRAEVAALSRQGMGELLQLEHESGEFVDPFMHGFIDKARKATGTLRKQITDPIRKGVKEVRKLAPKIIPAPIYDALKKFERYTVRPTAKAAVKGIAVLDQYVPGWNSLLDAVTVLPGGFAFGPLLKASAAAILAEARGQKIGEAFALAATSAYLVPHMPALTISKGTQTFLNTNGPFLTKFRATATEAVQSLSLIVTIAGTMLTGGAATPAFLALQAAVAALQAGMTVLNAKEAARLVKKQARALRNEANAELARISAEEAAYLAEIARIKAQIEEVRRQKNAAILAKRKKAALAARKKTQAAAGPISRAAESIGVSETTIIVGGLATIAGVIVAASMLQGDD